MTSRKPVALATMLAVGLASADVPIGVQHDATYSLPESRGLPCSGIGAQPVGTACPIAGDVATSDCQPYLLSYNGAVCVAPVDAQCALVRDDVWGCAFPKTGYSSAAEAETIAAYGGSGSRWGSGYQDDVQVGDEEETGVGYGKMKGDDSYVSTGTTSTTSGGRTNVETISTETNIDDDGKTTNTDGDKSTDQYSSTTTVSAEGGVASGVYDTSDPATTGGNTNADDLTGPSETAEGSTPTSTTTGGTTRGGGYTPGTTAAGNTASGYDSTSNMEGDIATGDYITVTERAKRVYVGGTKSGGYNTDSTTTETGEDRAHYRSTGTRTAEDATHTNRQSKNGYMTGGGHGSIETTTEGRATTRVSASESGYSSVSTITEGYIAGATPEDVKNNGGYTSGSTETTGRGTSYVHGRARDEDCGSDESSPVAEGDKTANYQIGTSEETEVQQTTESPSDEREEEGTPGTLGPESDEPCTETETSTELVTYAPAEETTGAPTEKPETQKPCATDEPEAGTAPPPTDQVTTEPPTEEPTVEVTSEPETNEPTN
ncbi:hypothetical protein F443_10994, partial [Phytophthora nicotianae P1569]